MTHNNIAIILDIDDTVYDQMIPFKNALYKYLSFPSHQLVSLFLSYRAYSDSVFEATQHNQMTIQDMHIYRLKQALLDYDYIISNELALAIQDDYATQQGNLHLDEHIIHLLNLCQQHNIPLGIISNGPSEHQWKKVHQLQLTRWIDPNHIIISQDVNVMKPDKQIFSILEQKMHLNKQHTYYIGDSYQNDIIGAKSAEWKAIWLNPYHKHITGHHTPDATLFSRLELYHYVSHLITNSL
ncbi:MULTISPECIES: HAD family hydrolase [unclassified Granulicatella]|uniref:HAD family hydrolase n=1 Tax=unclassified Granulicatella TaxID=2630493 RepID=UPI001073791A|nr:MULTISPECIES: HAD family hydrolase [unclassified Granulicatella]MBF0779887.1 HAD family hydrolase [Granulicatella sp. 19428wC4_WM01]TFU96091.1 HAD family hydrolase [Granulicatella sp. WM01]